MGDGAKHDGPTDGENGHNPEFRSLAEFDLQKLVSDPTLRLGIKTKNGNHYILQAHATNPLLIAVRRREAEAGAKVAGVIFLEQNKTRLLRVGQNMTLFQETGAETKKNSKRTFTMPIVEMRILSTTD